MLLSSSRTEQHTGLSKLVLVGVAKIVDLYLSNEAFSANLAQAKALAMSTKSRCIKYTKFTLLSQAERA